MCPKSFFKKSDNPLAKKHHFVCLYPLWRLYNGPASAVVSHHIHERLWKSSAISNVFQHRKEWLCVFNKFVLDSQRIILHLVCCDAYHLDHFRLKLSLNSEARRPFAYRVVVSVVIFRTLFEEKFFGRFWLLFTSVGLLLCFSSRWLFSSDWELAEGSLLLDVEWVGFNQWLYHDRKCRGETVDSVLDRQRLKPVHQSLFRVVYLGWTSLWWLFL